MTALEELRKKFKDQVAKAGGNLTVTAMLVRVLATAVQKFPQFNASLDPERGEIVYKKYVNIGVAVDTDRGLFVPVIRDANRKNITEIAVELQELAQKARDRKLTVDEMSGGGISISNLGGIGGTAFHSHRELARGRDPRRLSRRNRTGVAERSVRAAPAAPACPFPTTIA